MAADLYDGSKDRWMVNHDALDPPRLAFAITPDDNKDLTNATLASPMPSYATSLFIGGNTGAQTLSVVMAGDKSNGGLGTAVNLGVVPQGTKLNIQVRRVMQTNTSVTNIVGFID